jgi:hypothetical protein
MARQKRSKKSNDLLVMTAVGLVVWLMFADRLSTLVSVLVCATVLLVWVCVAMPTACDFRTRSGTPCLRRVRGKLCGCHDHGRSKRDALFALMKIRNPGMIFRVMWSVSAVVPVASGRAAMTSVAPELGMSRRDAGNVLVLLLTVTSALATTVALLV